MTKSLPSIYGFTIDNLRKKKEFYDSIGLSKIIFINPKQLIPSIDLIYARYMFYKNMGIEIDIDNYLLLFLGNKIFSLKYGIDREELVKSYPYVIKDSKIKKKVKVESGDSYV